MKVWRWLLRQSGQPFTVRSVGLWVSEYLAGSHRLGEKLDELASQDPDQWRRHFETWHSAETMAAHCGAGERTVRRAIEVLEDAGWLHVRRIDLETGRLLRAMNRPHVLTITIPPIDPRSERPEVEPATPGQSDRRSDVSDGHHRSQSPGDPRPESPEASVTESGGSGKPPVRVTDELSSRVSPEVLPSGQLTVAASADAGSVPAKSNPYELGRRYADHVASGTMSEDDVQAAAGHYSAQDRAEFLRGFRQGAAA